MTIHMDIARWLILKSDWEYSLQPKMEKLYTVSKNKTGSWLWLRSWTPYCQIQTEIKESRENHILTRQVIQVWPKSNSLQLYSGSEKYIQETRSDRMPEELWTEAPDAVQETGIKTILKKKNCKQAKWLSEEGLQIAEKRSKRQRRQGKVYPFECRVLENGTEK